jgi:hypothetical protein
MSLWSSSRPGIRVRVLPKFPARVTASTMMSITKSGASYTFGVTFANLTAVGSIASGDRDNYFVPFYNSDDGTYQRVAVDTLFTALGAAPSGASYVTLGTSSSLTSERVLTAGTGITITDGGAGSTVTITASASGIGSGTLTKADDTNVTLTLGGTPALALFNDVSITVGWTGTLANARLANMAQSTIKGRAAGAGTGVPTDLTATQATAILNVVVGDSGAGGTKGLAPAPAAGDAAAGKFLKADGTWTAPSGSASTGGGMKRRTLNGQFAIDQRNAGVATTAADNDYWADRWRYIGEASATVTAKDTTVGGGRFNGKVLFTGTTDKGGVWQIIEGINCKDLRSAAVTLSANLSVSNTRLGNIKMGIVEFTGTEDSVSGDPISAWGADGTTPTLAANYAFLNTPANLSVTTTPTAYVVTATVGASANNLAVVIWNDDKSYTANDSLYVTDVQLESGTLTAPQVTYERWDYSLEYSACRRYFRSISGDAKFIGAGYGASATVAVAFVTLAPPMRITPALTISSAGHFTIFPRSVTATVITLNAFSHTELAVLTITAASGLAIDIAAALGTSSASASLKLNSEI